MPVAKKSRVKKAAKKKQNSTTKSHYIHARTDAVVKSQILAFQRDFLITKKIKISESQAINMLVKVGLIHADDYFR